MRKSLLWVWGGLLLSGQVVALEGGYLTPPAPLLKVMRAPPPPGAALDPTGRTLLLIDNDPYPGIERVAEPYLKLGGVRIEPRTRARHDVSSGYGIRTCVAGYRLVDVETRKERKIALPANGCVGGPAWSPDGKRFAFDTTVDDLDPHTGAGHGKTIDPGPGTDQWRAVGLEPVAVPKVNASLVFHLQGHPEVGRQGTHPAYHPVFRGPGQIGVIEIENVVVLDAPTCSPPRTLVPHRLKQATSGEITLRQRQTGQALQQSRVDRVGHGRSHEGWRRRSSGRVP